MQSSRIPPLDLAGQIAEPRSGMMTRLGAQLMRTVNELIARAGGPTWSAIPLPSYTVAALPTTGIETGSLAYCTNETGGATVVMWDGSNWRRVQDRAVAS